MVRGFVNFGFDDIPQKYRSCIALKALENLRSRYYPLSEEVLSRDLRSSVTWTKAMARPGHLIPEEDIRQHARGVMRDRGELRLKIHKKVEDKEWDEYCYWGDSQETDWDEYVWT